jgi:hypothetical protein
VVIAGAVIVPADSLHADSTVSGGCWLGWFTRVGVHAGEVTERWRQGMKRAEARDSGRHSVREGMLVKQ